MANGSISIGPYSSDLPILVIDDDSAVRSTLDAILTHHGLTVHLAVSAEEGLAAIEEQAYLMVLCDIMMPGLSGLEFLARAQIQHAEIPIVIMTGFPTLERVVEALRGGASDFLMKPFDTASLMRTVERAVEGRRHVISEVEVESYCTQRISMALPSRADLITGAIEFICERSLLTDYYPAEARLQVRLAMHEAMSNALRHGNQRQVERKVRVEVLIDATCFDVSVEDEGTGFDPSRVPNPLALNLLEEPNGRGLFLISCYMDEVEHNARGNFIRMKKWHPARRPLPAVQLAP